MPIKEIVEIAKKKNIPVLVDGCQSAPHIKLDVSDLDSFQTTIEKAGCNDYLWSRWSQNGLDGVRDHFSWNAHVAKYLSLMSSEFKTCDLNNHHSSTRINQLSSIKAS